MQQAMMTSASLCRRRNTKGARCISHHRYPQAENQPHILALSVFSDTQIQRYKNQKS